MSLFKKHLFFVSHKIFCLTIIFKWRINPQNSFQVFFFWDDEIDLFLNLATYYLFITYVTALYLRKSVIDVAWKY